MPKPTSKTDNPDGKEMNLDVELTLILPTVAKSIFAYIPQTVQPLFEK